jgi:hypothetical protein
MAIDLDYFPNQDASTFSNVCKGKISSIDTVQSLLAGSLWAINVAYSHNLVVFIVSQTWETKWRLRRVEVRELLRIISDRTQKFRLITFALLSLGLSSTKFMIGCNGLRLVRIG